MTKMKTKKIFRYPVIISFMLLIAGLFTSCYNQQVVIDKVPLNTPEGTNIYITGNFNNWDPGDQKYMLTRNNDGTYSILLPRGVGKLEYKFTRGDWTSVEKNECGYEIGNRSLIYGEEEAVVNQVSCWGDTQPMNCTRAVIVITKYPANTPKEALIYIASQFNNWDPGNLKYTLKKHPKGFYYINLDKQDECMEFKFTLGDWESVETNRHNIDIENRRFCFDGRDTVFLEVNNWKSIKYRKTGKVTFVLEKLPALTKTGEQLYITGDFNNWDPGDPGYTFRSDSSGRMYYTLVSDKEMISFKITRGNWNSVEVLPSGDDISNRTYINGQADTVYLKVERWKDR